MRPLAATFTCALLALVTVAAEGCTADGDPAPDPSSAAPTGDSPASLPLSLLVFNVEYGGTRATDAVLADLDADVVGVLESYNRLPRIAAAAGYPYYNVGLQLLSRYPILEPSGADGRYAFLEVRPGEAVAMVNTHLDYVRDGPNRLARGVAVDQVLATEAEVRLATVAKLLPAAESLLADGWPVLLTGDLNEPSHLDWTAATAAQHDGIGPVAWPVSEALVGAGLRDSYREVHPDPVADPGTTWGRCGGTARLAAPDRLRLRRRPCRAGGQPAGRRERRGRGRPRLPPVDLRPPSRADPTHRDAAPVANHGRPVRATGHRR
ncbi:MAG: endonuclease/exonuclease/phosphatase family protein [Nocardioides sp.]